MGRFAPILLACSLIATVYGFRVHHSQLKEHSKEGQAKVSNQQEAREDLSENYQNGAVARLINVAEFETTFSKTTCQINGRTRGGQMRTLTLGRKLGSGAQGVVYAGMENGEETCAVKLSKTLDRKELDNLKQIAAKVRSQHMLTLEDGFENVEQCCGKACVITQLIRGKDMAHIMWDNGITTIADARAGKARKGAVSYMLMKSLVLQALAAYYDTERAGLCNHDQHLRNMMYEEESERVVFIDFGYAQGTRGACPPPAWVFKPEEDARTSLQSFYALGYLLEDPGDRNAFFALCGRIASGQYTSSAAALVGEFYESGAQDPRKPGAFFALHMDETIVEQLQHFKDTGSPHLGAPTAASPFIGGGHKGGGQVQMLPQIVPVQEHVIQKPVLIRRHTSDGSQPVVGNQTQTYAPDLSCHSTCGATHLQKARNGQYTHDFPSFPLTALPLAANECAKCYMGPDCNTGLHTYVGNITFTGGFQRICCRKMYCSLIQNYANVAPLATVVPDICRTYKGQIMPGYACKGCHRGGSCYLSELNPLECQRSGGVFCP